MFVITDNNDLDDEEKIANTTEDVYELALDYFYETAGQELNEAIANAADAKNWAEIAIEGDTYHGGDLVIRCV